MRSTCGVCTLRRFPSSVSTSRRSRPDVTSRLTRSARCFDSESDRVAHTDPFRRSYSWKLRFSFPPPCLLHVLLVIRASFHPFLGLPIFIGRSFVFQRVNSFSIREFEFSDHLVFRNLLTKLDRFIPMEVKVRETRAYRRIDV